MGNNIKAKGGEVKTFVRHILNSMTKFISENPVFGGISLIFAYFMFDNEFMVGESTELASDHIVLFSILSGYFAYYIVYLRRKLKGDLALSDEEKPKTLKANKNKIQDEPQEKLEGKDRKREIVFFIGLIITTLAIYFSYDTLIVKYLPSISSKYQKSEVVILLILAPIFEELAFRYLLYDKWSKLRYGKLIGGLIVAFIFIIAHPITNLVGFVVYWLPTLFLFMTYDSGGIKASIPAHIIYNLISIL